MPTPSLPDELLDVVLSHLDLFDVARVERTAKQWHRVARKNEQLWRDALYLDDGDKAGWDDAEMLARRIDALHQRSGGRMDGLAIQLMLPDCRHAVDKWSGYSHFQHIFDLLPRLGVNELRIELACDEDDDGDGEYEVLLMHIEHSLRQCAHYVETALRQCAHLTKLYYDVEEFSDSLAFTRSFVDTPLAKCALQHLHVLASPLGTHKLFDDDSLLAMLRTAQHVTLPIDSVHVWRVLEAASATLEDVSLDVMVHPAQDDARPSEPSRRVALPNLTSLKIRMATDPTPSPPRRPNPLLDHQLVCPALQHFALADYAEWLELFRNLFHDPPPALQTLCIGDLDQEDCVVGLGALLNERYSTSLRALKFLGDASALIGELTSCPQLLLDDVTFVQWDNDFESVTVQQVRDLVQSRLALPSYRPFRAVRFVETRETDVLSFDDEEEEEDVADSDEGWEGDGDEDEDDGDAARGEGWEDDDEEDSNDPAQQHRTELNSMCKRNPYLMSVAM